MWRNIDRVGARTRFVDWARKKYIRVEVKREEETNLTFSRVPNLINLDDVTLNFVDCFTFSRSLRCRIATETTLQQNGWGFCARRMWLKFVWQPKPPVPGLNVHVRRFLAGKKSGRPNAFLWCRYQTSRSYDCVCDDAFWKAGRCSEWFFLLLCSSSSLRPVRQMCWLFPVCTHSSSLHVYELSIVVPFLFHSGRCRDSWLRAETGFRKQNLHLRAYILPHRARSNLFITLRAIPAKVIKQELNTHAPRFIIFYCFRLSWKLNRCAFAVSSLRTRAKIIREWNYGFISIRSRRCRGE